jgi:hypothetical protein
MDSPTRTTVRRALDELKPYLMTYVTQTLKEARTARQPGRTDVQALLSTMLEHWEAVFARQLSPTVRHYVFELKDIRNRWAHEEAFSQDEARRAADTARLVAKAIGAPNTLVESLGRLGRDDTSAATSSPAPRPTMRPQASANLDRRPAAPRRDGHGVILNANELSADEVALQRVRCPACEEKVFETWPGGWDAHAAHVCRGIPPGSEAERKAAYRSRYAHLFRNAGAIARPTRQRDIMRRLYGIYRPDEDRVIREYALAERRGEVGRASNTAGIDAVEYARRLLADGLKKGWLTA